MEELNEHYELIKTFLPKYLSTEQSEKLFKDLENYFPSSSDSNVIYSRIDINLFYQGDGINEMVFHYLNRQKKSFDVLNLDALIISNTCDIDEENFKSRIIKPNVVLSAMFSLDKYLEKLRSKGIEESRIEGFIRDIKSNKISNLFYLPPIEEEGIVVLEESFVQFDFMTSHPLEYLTDRNIFSKEYTPNGDRLFSFSNYGFYLLLFKLSVHFSRFREGVFRN